MSRLLPVRVVPMTIGTYRDLLFVAGCCLLVAGWPGSVPACPVGRFRETGDSSVVFPATAISMTTDHLNNIYLVTPENTIEKRDDTGKVLCTFSDKRYGTPKVDATDPMKVVAFYDDQNILVTLDNTLSPIGTINFSLLEGFRNPTLAATSSQGGFWVYDADEFRIKHVDESGAVTIRSDDLSVGNMVSDPVSLIDRSGKLYLCDSSLGVLIFDSYLNFEKLIEGDHITYAEVIEDQLFYLADSTINKLDLKTFEFRSITLLNASDLRAVSVQKGRLLLLLEDAVEVRIAD